MAKKTEKQIVKKIKNFIDEVDADDLIDLYNYLFDPGNKLETDDVEWE